MKVRHLMGLLHSFSIENIFYDRIDLKFFYFDVDHGKLSLHYSKIGYQLMMQSQRMFHCPKHGF